jgi:hypothetical protein
MAHPQPLKLAVETLALPLLPQGMASWAGHAIDAASVTPAHDAGGSGRACDLPEFL